mgnify:FL=1
MVVLNVPFIYNTWQGTQGGVTERMENLAGKKERMPAPSGDPLFIRPNAGWYGGHPHR